METMTASTWSLRRLHALDDALIDGLADVLIDCVEGGASVSFMHPLSRDRARAFWRRVGQGVAAGERALLVAEDGTGVCGTVQLILDQPENQPHRADLAKMLVHRRARRAGIGAALLRAAEATARECGKTLLVLDTASDEAERLYERQGWVRVGEIPGYALLPYGGLCRTTMYYRDLGGWRAWWRGRLRAAASRERSEERPAMPIKGIDHWVIVAGDLQRTLEFYRRLGFTIAWEKRPGRPDMATIRINEAQKINVHGPEAPARTGYLGARHPAVGGADFCLEWDGTVDEVVALLKANGIAPEAGPGPRSCARGVSTSVYFRDPDDNLVEFTVYDRPA